MKPTVVSLFIGYGPITLDAFQYETSGFSFLASPQWQQAVCKQDKRIIGAALFGLSYIIKRIAPSFCMGDRNDIQTDVALDQHKNSWESTLFLYDSIEGGVGYAEIIFQSITAVLEMCLKNIDQCTCEMGCPACIPPLPPGVEEEDMEEYLTQTDAAITATHSLIHFFLTGEIYLPVITTHKKQFKLENNQPIESEAVLQARAKLNQAAQMLARKKEREH